MEKLPLFFILFFFPLFLFSQEGKNEAVYSYGQFLSNSIVYTWGDAVNIRSKPSLTAEKIATLAIGTPLKILENKEEENEMEQNGYKERWYKVRGMDAQNNPIEGYVWGGLLSKATWRGDLDKDGIDELVLCGIIRKNNIPKNFVEARVVKKNKIIAKTIFEAIDVAESNYFSYTMGIESLGFKGFWPPIFIFRVFFEYGACDYPNGEVILFWNSQTLNYGLKAVKASNEMGGVTYRLIFPDEKGGKTNELIIEYHTQEYDEENPEKIVRETRETHRYVWDGKKIKQKK